MVLWLFTSPGTVGQISSPLWYHRIRPARANGRQWMSAARTSQRAEARNVSTARGLKGRDTPPVQVTRYHCCEASKCVWTQVCKTFQLAIRDRGQDIIYYTSVSYQHNFHRIIAHWTCEWVKQEWMAAKKMFSSLFHHSIPEKILTYNYWGGGGGGSEAFLEQARHPLGKQEHGGWWCTNWTWFWLYF